MTKTKETARERAAISRLLADIKRGPDDLDARNKGFMQGFAVAVGILVSGWGETGLAEMIVREGNFFYHDFVDAEVDEYDLKLLREAGVHKRVRLRKTQ